MLKRGFRLWVFGILVQLLKLSESALAKRRGIKEAQLTKPLSAESRLIRRAILRRAIGVLVLVVILFVAISGIWIPIIGRWLAVPPSMPGHRADAIIVHGGNLTRSLYAIDLYQQGLGVEFWHTGYAHSEAHITGLIVDRGGVSSQQFHFLPTTDTWSDGQAIAARIKAHQIRSVLIVTNWWHSRRALCATKQQLQGYNIEIAFQPAPSLAGPEDWWLDGATRSRVLHELGGLVGYGLRYGMNPWGC